METLLDNRGIGGRKAAYYYTYVLEVEFCCESKGAREGEIDLIATGNHPVVFVEYIVAHQGKFRRCLAEVCLIGCAQIENGIAASPDFFIHDRSSASIDAATKYAPGFIRIVFRTEDSRPLAGAIDANTVQLTFCCFFLFGIKVGKTAKDIPLVRQLAIHRKFYAFMTCFPVFRLERFAKTWLIDAN